jgi:photosystem II stability/assembly factor-like uncharacterized protein
MERQRSRLIGPRGNTVPACRCAIVALARRSALVALAAGAACGSPSAPKTGPTGPTGPETPPQALGWALLPNAPSAPSDIDRFDDVYFVSADTGWVVNVDGELYQTTDGGASWVRRHDATADEYLRSVGFANDSVGWIGNLNRFNNPLPSKALFETRDGGKTLTNITSRITGPEPVGICGLWVASDSTIYGVGRWSGPAVFIRSFDQGQTWESFDMSSEVTGLVDVYFSDPQHGLIVGGRGVGNLLEQQQSSYTVILATADSGTTWQERYVSPTRGTWAWKISFPTPDTGYVSVQGTADAGTVLKTVDGGVTWAPLHVADSVGFSGIGFASATTGWVGADFKTFETTDGGASWHEVTLGTPLNRFRMLGPMLGYAIGRQVYRFTGIP